MRTRGICVTGLAAMPLTPGIAQAATRHAAPDSVTASGTCAPATPCTLGFAVSGASAGDTVSPAQGTHAVTADLAPTVADLTIEGASTTPVLSLGATERITNFAPRMTLRNLRVQGGNAGAADIAVSDIHNAGGDDRVASLDVGFSAYGSGRLAVTVADASATGDGAAGNNIATTPSLVDLAGATDLHQLGGSPTIDAGSAAAVTAGAADVEGDPREIGAAPDIGADEYVPAPAATTGAATAVTATRTRSAPR